MSEGEIAQEEGLQLEWEKWEHPEEGEWQEVEWWWIWCKKRELEVGELEGDCVLEV